MKTTYDIIGDIHGHARELKELLKKLGYAPDEKGVYTHPQPGRQALFTGDYIDRGTENFEVIDIVRAMVSAGRAQAIMGNHELNAGLYHTHVESADGGMKPLRSHKPKHTLQHQAFLDEMHANPIAGRKNIEWIKSLPICLEKDGLRLAHAMWDQPSLDYLRQSGVLADDYTILPGQWPRIAEKDTPAFHAICNVTKGIEIDLPENIQFIDKEGNRREKARLKWWGDASMQPLTLDKVLLDVPPETISAIPVSDEIKRQMRPAQQTDLPLVIFGHYWQTGEFPVLESKGALCIDQSVAKDGYLAAATITVEGDAIADITFSSVKSRPPEIAQGGGVRR